MSKRYSIAEARASLPTILDEVEAGTQIELTRRGKPVAVVVSRPVFDRLTERRTGFVEAYEAFRTKHRLDEIGIEGDELEGIRESSTGRVVDL